MNKKLKIITEFHPNLLRRGGSSPEEFLNVLKGYGFKFYDINEEEETIKPCDADSVLKAYGDFGGWQPPNLLCVREG